MEKFTTKRETRLPLGIQKIMLYVLVVKVLIIIFLRRMKMSNYNINDVLSVGNPLDDGKGFECIKCNQAGEMSFSPYPVNDWGCGYCGEWQQEGEK
jgi:hypothetical protein